MSQATYADGSSITYTYDAAGNRLSAQIITRGPSITAQAQDQVATAGGTAVFSISASGIAPLSYRWQVSVDGGGTWTNLNNDANYSGVATATLTLNSPTSAMSGYQYRAIVTDATGSTTSASALATINDPSATNAGRLINLSILTSVTASDPLFTVGTVIGGAGTSGSKPLLVRAAGPSLTQVGVSGVLPDPKLDLFSGQTVIGTNDNWGGTATLSNAFAQTGAFAYASATSKDAAIFNAAMPAGAYTVQIRGVSGAIGTVIAELYDATPANAFTSSTPRLINVSVLKQINTGSILTTGFVIGGTTNQTVLIRAVGPTLGIAPYNVGGVMADPKLDLFSGQTVINSNNDWGTPVGGGAATAAQLSAAFSQVGAFPLVANSRDSALLVTLAPGPYTAQVSAANGTTGGIALVEVYECQQTAVGGTTSNSNGDSLTNGGAHNGTITAGSLDSWAITLANGDSLMLQAGKLTGTSSFAPAIRLYDPAGTLVQSSWGNSAAMVSYRATIAGSYKVVVYSYFSDGTGTYQLHVVKAPGAITVPADDEGGPLTNGGVHNGTITTGDLDPWTITLASGDSLMLEAGKLTGTSSFAPSISLYDPAGALVQSNWGNSATGVYQHATIAGSYTAVVYSYFSDGTGTYQLHAVKAPGTIAVPAGDEGGPLTNGGVHNGTITSGDLDAWTITLASGDSLMLQAGKLTGTSSFAPAISLYDPAGALVQSNWGNSATGVYQRATIAGSYTAVVYSYFLDGTGTYQLHAVKAPGTIIVPVADEGGPLTNVQNGTITSADLDAWTITLASGDSLTLQLGKLTGTSSFAPAISLYDPAGALVQSNWGNSTAGVYQRATITGSYTAVVYSYFADGTGTYQLTAVKAP